MNIETLIMKLLSYYQIKTLNDLAIKLDTTQSTISGWKARNAIGALTDTVANKDPEALEFIFSSNSNIQMNNDVSGGQIAKTVKGNLITNNQIIDDIDNSTLSLFKEAYYKAKESDDIKGFRIYLMEYK
ncbi:hypothetical protein SDC9_11920 [bioreactor metagenome]|uniref:Uncharacterized protein n=1 Tax=bioreactor metagenome TaxID=1076179 RepID=A0A644TKL7_9ZZZZ